MRLGLVEWRWFIALGLEMSLRWGRPRCQGSVMQDPNGSTIELCCYTPTALNAGLQSLQPVACSPGQCQAVCLIPSALPGYGLALRLCLAGCSVWWGQLVWHHRGLPGWIIDSLLRLATCPAVDLCAEMCAGQGPFRDARAGKKKSVKWP